MLSPRRRSLHVRSAFHWVAALSALAVLSACTSSVAGLPVRSAVPSGSSSSTVPTGAAVTSGGGQITEPSVLPGPSTTTTPPGTGAPTTPGTVAGPVPKGLDKFYTQQLAWGSCPSYATDADAATAYRDPGLQCARLTVPLSYSDPTGQTVKVAVLRKVATDPSARIGSLVIDPGGPGGSGMTFVAQVVQAPAQSAPSSWIKSVTALNARFDLVGIDPRGIGSSLPAVQCQTDAQKDQARTFVPRSRTQADVATANAITSKRAAECVANTGRAEGVDGKTFLANVGTRDVARDLDVLRAVLGDKKLSYLGFSYGTEIGWEYAEQFPANVRAILFDGDVNPDKDAASMDLGQYQAFQAAFDSFAQWCATTSPSCALGTDTTRSLARYEALTRPLLATPLPLDDGRTMSFGDAQTGTTQALYDDQLRTALAKALLDLSQGNGTNLMALADDYDERDAKGHYSNILEAYDAVRCVDNARTTDPAQVTRLNAANAAASPYQATGDPAGALLDPCAVWPVPPTLLPHVLKIKALPKMLVISTTGDPATPYADGVELAKEIGGTLLTAVGVRHTSYLLSGVTCVDDIGNAYLLNLTLPAGGTTCR